MLAISSQHFVGPGCAFIARDGLAAAELSALDVKKDARRFASAVPPFAGKRVGSLLGVAPPWYQVIALAIEPPVTAEPQELIDDSGFSHAP